MIFFIRVSISASLEAKARYGYRSTRHNINGTNLNGQTDQLLYTSTKTG
jgi:hypothetical protein